MISTVCPIVMHTQHTHARECKYVRMWRLYEVLASSKTILSITVPRGDVHTIDRRVYLTKLNFMLLAFSNARAG